MNIEKPSSNIKFVVVMSLILLIIFLYVYGARQQLENININMDSNDQSAYMEYSQKMVESNYTFIGGRNRMPVYPFIQSLFYDPQMGDEAFFRQGKYINLLLSVAILLSLTVIFRKFFSWFHTFNLLLITAFQVFIFKAGFFQAELLFYFLSFCLFLLMWRLLQSVSWKLIVLTGIVAGITHLTKASILPGLLLFLILACIKWGWVTYQNFVNRESSISVRWVLSQPIMVVFVGIIFLATIFPYIYTSKKVFGQYFYNVNSTFYIWYDSWAEAKRGTRAHGDRVGWPTLPPEEIPSPSKYLREHTWTQILDRIVNGAKEVFQKAIHSYGYFKYLVIYITIFVVALLTSRQKLHQFIKNNLFLCLFFLGYFSGYMLLYFWYAPIASGNRFFLALFLPLMFVLAYGIYAVLSPVKLYLKKFAIVPLTLFNLCIMCLILIDSYLVLTVRINVIFGGT